VTHTAEFDAPINMDVLRSIAEAADHGGRHWSWTGGYPQQVIRVGDVMLVAETYEGPDFPSTLAEYIAAFDPPTVLALLDEIADLRTRPTPPAVTECPDCGQTGRYDRRVIVDGRGVYTCPNRHRWQDADETPDDKGYTRVYPSVEGGDSDA
jgi:hypothetical protein